MEFLGSREAILALTIANRVIVPLALLLWLGRARANDRVQLLLRATFVTSYIALVCWEEVYFFQLSGHLRWVWIAGCAVALAAAIKRSTTLAWRPQFRPLGRAVKLVAVGLLALLFASGLIGYRVEVASADVYQGQAIELKFPLVHARAYVLHGGSSLAWNHHAIVPGQRYALDIVAIEPVWRRSARGAFPEDVRAYFVYGSHVVAPCSGTVATSENGLADQTPPDMDPEHAAGNHVVLHCDGNSVLLAHLQKGSVKVSVGQRVRAGQLVGFVGNSGNTSEPHLHIEAVEGLHTTMPELDRATAAPMLFRGRFLVRGDIVDGRF